MAGNVCIFCGPTSAKMTGEHIYSKWISRKLRALGVELYEVQRYKKAEPLGKPFTKKAGGLDTKTHPRCCEPCNNDWLGGIEKNHLSKFFFDLVLGKRVRLSTDQQIILGVWLTRLAMALEFVDEADPNTFYTQEEREQFRQDTFPPAQTKIWAACYQGNAQAIFGSHVLPRFIPEHEELGLLLNVTTGTIGRFAFQVWSLKFLNTATTASDEDLEDVFRPIIKPWARATFQLWPELGRPLTWPPSPIVDDRALQSFADRFGGDSRLS